MGDASQIAHEGAPWASGQRDAVGFGILVLGLSCFWSLFRRAGIMGLVATTGLDQALAVAVFYALFVACTTGACAIGSSGRLSSHLSPVCLAASLLAAALLAVTGAAAPLSWLALAASALATSLLALLGLRLCSRSALFGDGTALAAACASMLVSIVVTFALADVLPLGSTASIVYLVLAALGMFCANSLLAPGPAHPEGGQTQAGTRVTVLCVVLVAATLLKSFTDAAFQDADLRLTKHLVGLVGLSLPLGVLAIWQPATTRTVALYACVIGLLAGSFLSAAPLPAALCHIGAATVTTACALSQALLMAHVSQIKRSAAYGPLIFAVPSALAGYLGCTLLGIDGAGDVVSSALQVMAMAVLAGAGIAALVALCARELGDEGGEPDVPAPTQAQIDAHVAQALADRYELTAREATVAGSLYQGKTVKEIAQAECLSVSTVQSHSKSIYRKMGIHSRQDLVTLADALLKE